MKKRLLLVLLCVLFAAFAFLPEKTPERAMEKVLKAAGLSAAGPIKSEVVTLPPADDATWAGYIKMQAENGYNMRPYCGKAVQKLSCEVTERRREVTVYVHLYWQDGKILGGDIMTVAIDGYMQGIPPVSGI